MRQQQLHSIRTLEKTQKHIQHLLLRKTRAWTPLPTSSMVNSTLQERTGHSRAGVRQQEIILIILISVLEIRLVPTI